jgi:hypothetical protein
MQEHSITCRRRSVFAKRCNKLILPVVREEGVPVLGLISNDGRRSNSRCLPLSVHRALALGEGAPAGASPETGAHPAFGLTIRQVADVAGNPLSGLAVTCKGKRILRQPPGGRAPAFRI